MKFILLFSFSLVCFCTAFSQIKQFVSIDPNWDINKASLIRETGVRIDSVFLYPKKERSHDSTLMLVDFFDTTGNIVEKDEYAFNRSGLWRLTTYSYSNGLLLNKQVHAKPNFIINDKSYGTKDIYTYDYDSAGNNITEKLYSYTGAALDHYSLTIWNREYDSAGHLIKEYETLSGQEPYLHCTYNYNNGSLSETSYYDKDKNLMYAYLHRYDTELNVASISLTNRYNSNSLQSELFYDDKKRLIQEKHYSYVHLYLDHTTQNYFYDANGLIQKQSFQDLSGNNYYYKHFYFLLGK